MSPRSAVIQDFLADTPYTNWSPAQLAGDASSRRYQRLTYGTQSIILMEAPTDPSMQAFVDIADWLRAMGLCAPEIAKVDTNKGLMLLQDLGQTDFASWISDGPADALQLYQAATDVLIKLDTSTPPKGLSVMTPEVGGEMVEITPEWYAGNAPGTDLTQQMATALAAHCGPPTTIALRDYHAENLIWRPNSHGTDRVGLLDFQDAFIAPRGYDLISLLRDARRHVDPAVAKQMAVHFATGVGTTPDNLLPALATLAVQRNLRILGVFARLALRDGKYRYVRMIPHLWDMLGEDLQHPALANLRHVVQSTLPPPEQSAIKDLL